MLSINEAIKTHNGIMQLAQQAHEIREPYLLTWHWHYDDAPKFSLFKRWASDEALLFRITSYGIVLEHDAGFQGDIQDAFEALAQVFTDPIVFDDVTLKEATA